MLKKDLINVYFRTTNFDLTLLNREALINIVPVKGQTFEEISLDDYVIDGDHGVDQISWTYSGNAELTVTIDENRVASVTLPHENWPGIETIIFTATDPDGHTGQDGATFTVISAQDITILFLP